MKIYEKYKKLIGVSIAVIIVILIVTLATKPDNDYFTTTQAEWIEENQKKTIILGVPEGEIMYEFSNKLTKRIENDLGLKFDIVQNPHRINTKEFREGNIDLLLGLNQTAVREKTMLFTETLMQYPYMCFYRQDQAITNLEDLREHRVGFVRGTEVIQAFSTKYPLLGSECVYYETDEEATHALKSGDVSSIILDCYGVTFIDTTMNKAFKLDNIQKDVKITTQKENLMLYSIINQEINWLIKDGWTEETYQTALLNYQKKSLNLTEEEQAYLKDIDILNVSSTLEFEPFYLKDNQHTYGINIEIMQQLSKLLNIQIQYNSINSFAVEQSLNKGVVDMVIGMYDGQPIYDIVPTNPIVEQSYITIGKSKEKRISSIYDLAPYKLAVLDNGSIGSQIENEMYNTDITTFKEPVDVYKSIHRGEAEYAVLPEVVVESQSDDISYYNLSIKGSFDHANVVLFLNDSNSILLNIMNKSLNIIDTQQSVDCAIKELPKRIPKMTYLYIILILLSICLGIAGLIFVINRRRRVELERKQIEQLAYYDGLTSLYNKRGIERWFKSELQHPKKMKIAALSFDLDNFKQVNDRYGHEAGDRILMEVAKNLQLLYQNNGVCARLGGDEFLLLIKNCNEKQAQEEAERMIENLLRNVMYNNIKPNIELSIGIVIIPTHTNNFEKMLTYSDIAMYQAKRFKKGNFVMFEPTMHKNHQTYIRVYAEVKEAIANKSFDVWYQPIYLMKSNRICSAEALIRWKQNNGENVRPDIFLPIVRQLGLMNQLDYFVLEEACKTLKKCQEIYQYYYPVSVNLSMKTVKDPDIVNKVREILYNTKLEPQYLILELTEQESITNLLGIKRTFLALKQLGVSIALDDFGDGYSNFECLTELPIDVIKIDKSIADKLCLSKRNIKIIQYMCMLSESLMMATIIEGIETDEQLEQLRNMKLDTVMIQGYLYSKPLNKQQFIQLLTKNQLEAKGQ